MIFLFVIIAAYHFLGTLPWISINNTNSKNRNLINLVTKKMIILFVIINLYGFSIFSIVYSICCIFIVSVLNKDYTHINLDFVYSMLQYNNITDFVHTEKKKIFMDIPYYELKHFLMKTHKSITNPVKITSNLGTTDPNSRKLDKEFAQKEILKNNSIYYNKLRQI